MVCVGIRCMRSAWRNQEISVSFAKHFSPSLHSYRTFPVPTVPASARMADRVLRSLMGLRSTPKEEYRRDS